MRTCPSLGSVNAALISLYFVPVWGGAALKALTSPLHGFEDRAHATAAVYFRQLFDFGLDGLVRMSQGLAAIKLLVAVAFAAYLIDFARALLVRRPPNSETLDVVLMLAGGAIMLWAWPALGSGDAALIRLNATQFILLTGAMMVILVERELEKRAAEMASSPTPLIAGAQPGLPASTTTAPASFMA